MSKPFAGRSPKRPDWNRPWHTMCTILFSPSQGTPPLICHCMHPNDFYTHALDGPCKLQSNYSSITHVREN